MPAGRGEKPHAGREVLRYFCALTRERLRRHAFAAHNQSSARAGKRVTIRIFLPGGGNLRRFPPADGVEMQARIAEFGNNVEALRKVRDSAQGDVLPTRTRLEKLLKSVV